jgi:hypothetical protein
VERNSLKNNVFVGNFAENLVNILQEHFERSAMSGLSVFKRAECRSVKIPGLDDLPHQQTTTMSTEFVL